MAEPGDAVNLGGRAERPVLVRLGKEIQEMLRRGDRELIFRRLLAAIAMGTLEHASTTRTHLRLSTRYPKMMATVNSVKMERIPLSATRSKGIPFDWRWNSSFVDPFEGLLVCIFSPVKSSLCATT
jgi:hypothetical protein